MFERFPRLFLNICRGYSETVSRHLPSLRFLPVAIYRMIHFSYVKSNHITVFIKYKNTSKETLDVILFEDRENTFVRFDNSPVKPNEKVRSKIKTPEFK